MKLLGQYQNGNYSVKLFDDGTKIRENDLDFFEPEYPESMDIKITNQCDMMCSFCHEKSTPDGQHGDILNLPFLDTLLPYTELAIGGGNPLSHPDLIPFLQGLKDRKLIANITVNEKHLRENVDLLRRLSDENLIYGLGISISTDQNPESLNSLLGITSTIPNTVFHVIHGEVELETLKHHAHTHSKILILGYKLFGRGVPEFQNHTGRILIRQKLLYDTLPTMLKENWFDVISFDNLAVQQLGLKQMLDEKSWNEHYMGNDGKFTMYVDAVNRQYAICSTSKVRRPLEDDIRYMFKIVRHSIDA